MNKFLTDKEIKDLTTSEPEKAAEYIKLLQGRLNLGSHNSGMPPSSDIFPKKKIKNNRNKTTKSKGGQAGHRGTTIKFDKIDFIVDLKPSTCIGCGASLTDAGIADKQLRHVSDFNDNWKLEVTCYKSLSLVCPSCSCISKGVFPDNVNAWAQYGPKIQSLVTYFSSYQLLPVERLQECLKEIFKVKISQATLLNLVKKTADNLDGFLSEIRKLLIDSSVVHFDETSMRTENKKCWGHVSSTTKLTLISAGDTRGLTSMIGARVLPEFTGTAIHDGMTAYFFDDFDFSHGLCNIHHLRELKFVHEEMSQRWAMKMRSLLMDIKTTVEKAKDCGENKLNNAIIRSYEEKYRNVIDMGLRHPENTKRYKPPGRGRAKQSKSKNLLDRLENTRAVLAFMYNFEVPFDNNLAERDLRMSKVKQKISGCFRGKAGMDTFCKIRSYMGTMRKNSIDILQGLFDAATGSPFMPAGT